MVETNPFDLTLVEQKTLWTTMHRSKFDQTLSRENKKRPLAAIKQDNWSFR